MRTNPKTNPVEILRWQPVGVRGLVAGRTTKMGRSSIGRVPGC